MSCLTFSDKKIVSQVSINLKSTKPVIKSESNVQKAPETKKLTNIRSNIENKTKNLNSKLSSRAKGCIVLYTK